MAPVQKMPKDEFKKQMDIVYSLLSMLNSDPSMSPNSFRLLGGNNSSSSGKELKVNCKVLEAVMRLTFEEKYKQSICNLEGLEAIAAILMDTSLKLNGKACTEKVSKTLRLTCMALTNLTFGDAHNKNTVCSIEGFVPALVKLLAEGSEDVRKVVAGVVRNISWKADAASKKILRESGMVFALLKCSMESERESSLKCLLNALWNVSSHSADNKADICEYSHSLEFIVSLLGQSETIIENGGGILKNISSHIAVNDQCRQILRKHKCLEILLGHLQLSNMVVVANACGTLWNLSARCSEDQQSLWKLGAVGLLGNLVNSEDKSISVGSSAALKNLLLFKTNSSSLFSSCSSSPSDDKNKETAYWHDNKHTRFKEKEADTSTINSYQPINFTKPFSSNMTESNNHQIKEIFQNDMKSENQYYGLDESADEMIDFSTKYKEICLGSNNDDQLLDSSKPLYSPSDQPKLYCTEDTPENYSEINAPTSYNINHLDTSMGFVLTTTSSHVDSKLFDKPQKTILMTHKSSGSSENSSHPNSGQKSVTFSETNQTPMMFSRTTSMGSVNSLEAPSVHSSVSSVYSHRPSGVVSPSELPDSPGETMPPSPREAKHCSVLKEDKTGVTRDDNGNTDDVNDLDFSDNENDELLEEVIQAAMPGCKNQKKEIKKPEYIPNKFKITEAPKAMYEEDTLKCYRSEGTPLTFSRNDSLSSLGSKESPQRPNNYSLTTLHPKVTKFIVNHDRYFKPSNLTSTPSTKTIPILEDQVLKYEVEGTPDKMPPLSFDDVDDLPDDTKPFNYLTSPTQQTITTTQALTTIQTPCIEALKLLDDSDSSVSFNSSDVDSSPNDNKLLQECIASGLPKNKKRKHKRFLFDYDQLKKKTEEVKCSKDDGGLKAHDLSRVAYSEDDDYPLSGPSTEANNTVIYRGLLLNGEDNDNGGGEDGEVMVNGCEANLVIENGVHGVDNGKKNGAVVNGEKVGEYDGHDDNVMAVNNGKDDGMLVVEDGDAEDDGVVVYNKEDDGVVVNDEENINYNKKVEKGDGSVINYIANNASNNESLEITLQVQDHNELSNNIKETSENPLNHTTTFVVNNEFGGHSLRRVVSKGGEVDELGDGASEEGAMGLVGGSNGNRDGIETVSNDFEVASTASDGKYFTDNSSRCTDEYDFLNIVSDFYEKTCIQEMEDTRYKFKTNSPITSSISDGNIKNSRDQEWLETKEKRHSKSKIFNFLKKSLRRKKKSPT